MSRVSWLDIACLVRSAAQLQLRSESFALANTCTNTGTGRGRFWLCARCRGLLVCENVEMGWICVRAPGPMFFLADAGAIRLLREGLCRNLFGTVGSGGDFCFFWGFLGGINFFYFFI